MGWDGVRVRWGGVSERSMTLSSQYIKSENTSLYSELMYVCTFSKLSILRNASSASCASPSTDEVGLRYAKYISFSGASLQGTV